ncbi:hypothetical protein [Ligilactobacillus sp. 110_WCHN]|uniref:hypothetical protein n=1 Tax=Ligilactobacillus sp. 110_WCHN TaxID=3057125 RepID=UPI00267108CA|nr:hypothetical protein [Ligilactobacillus sp. 110_WCHN]MDO3393902.1 hypothetical protein [Ligilactobacillus sp. 110_WCHN]
MPNKRKLEDNLNKVFDCKDIHVHEMRDIDDSKLTQLLITNSNFSLRMQFVKKKGDVFAPIMTYPKISMANLGKAIDYIEKYFDERG